METKNKPGTAAKVGEAVQVGTVGKVGTVSKTSTAKTENTAKTGSANQGAMRHWRPNLAALSLAGFSALMIALAPSAWAKAESKKSKAESAAAATAATKAPAIPTKDESRCGWFSNPAPASVWLADKEGQWTISQLGGHQAEGEWPKFKDQEWVKIGDNYGYGCACLKMKTDIYNKRVMNIVEAKTQPLAQCKKDKALKSPTLAANPAPILAPASANAANPNNSSNSGNTKNKSGTKGKARVS